MGSGFRYSLPIVRQNPGLAASPPACDILRMGRHRYCSAGGSCSVDRCEIYCPQRL